MGFLLNGQPLSADRPFTDAQGTQYPANWLRLASEEEKAAVGVTWEADPEPYNKMFWSGRDGDGNLIARQLEDETVEGTDVVTKGLKSALLRDQKIQAGTLLAATDWYVTRKAEDSTAEIPADVSSYRAAVRTVSGTREAEITACTTMAELEALLSNPAQTYNADTDEMVANTEPFITPWPEQI